MKMTCISLGLASMCMAQDIVITQNPECDVDAASEKYRDYFQTLVPEKYRDQVDVRAFSPGKRIVFEPYTKEVYESTHQWMEEINIFPDGQLGHAAYEDAVLV